MAGPPSTNSGSTQVLVWSHAERSVDDPAPELRLGLIVLLMFFVGFVGWAAFARMDAAAFAQGQLVVSGQRQSVQHRDGGVVNEILVREGDSVREADLLVRLAAAEVRAQERALSSQVIGLLAQRTRLEAEQLRLRSVQAPPEFASLAGEDRAWAQNALRLQQAQLETRRSVLAARQGVIGQRSARAAQESEGFRRQVTASAEQGRLISEELEALRGVAEKGFVSKTRLRALERAQADLEGRRGQYAATAAQAREVMAEARLEVVEAERSHQAGVAAELREVEAALADLQPRLAAAKDQMARTEIRAPVSGTVVGLSIFTVGGVVTPGQKLMDIVPDAAPLVIEARIEPADADDLAAGQRALVRFASLHDRTLPALEGTLSRLSADSFIDGRSGQSFFTAEIMVAHDQLKLVHDRRSQEFALRAGTPVEVLIPLRKRTALQYAFEPLQGTFWKAFREQ
jgi:HlyD family type I secretion membrane fusion protein